MATNPAYLAGMSLRERTRPGLEINEPCLPSAAKAPPSGPRLAARGKARWYSHSRAAPAGVRLITRNGTDFTDRFAFFEMTVKSLLCGPNFASANCCRYR